MSYEFPRKHLLLLPEMFFNKMLVIFLSIATFYFLVYFPNEKPVTRLIGTVNYFRTVPEAYSWLKPIVQGPNPRYLSTAFFYIIRMWLM